LSVSKRPSSVSVAKASISWAHELAGYQNPCNHGLVSHIFKAHQLTKVAPPQPKKAISVRHMQELILTSLVASPDCLSKLRTAVFVVLCFSGLLRSAEALALRISDLTFQSDHLSISVQRPKCSRVPENVLIQKSNLFLWCVGIVYSTFAGGRAPCFSFS
jgi:integrase